MTTSSAGPVSQRDFAALMARLGPFEPAPHIAVAVSGGADSLALALLLADWCRARKGRLLALTVDHGLRPAAAKEAAWVRKTLAGCGVQHQTLRWRGDKPASSIQAAARAARYRLLSDSCRSKGVLHLALGHHLDDQAETFLLRLGRGSGLDGLSAMAPLSAGRDLRLLRPLLALPKSRLEATLRARGLGWIEDPSNRDPAFSRIRLRDLMPALAAEGLTPARLAATAGRLGQARAALETSLAACLAAAAVPDPAGFVTLDPAALAAAPREVSLRALARCLMTVGGTPYGPRLERLERLHDGVLMGSKKAATLGGCRVIPRKSGLLVTREAAKAAELAIRPGQRLLWDGRFSVHLGRRPGPCRGDLTLGPLGRGDRAQIRENSEDSGALRRLPAAVWPALPALRDGRGLVAVPALGYARPGWTAANLGKWRFCPENGLTSGVFTVV